MEHLALWGQFFIASLFIVFAGFKLTKYGDIFSEKLHLGHAFIGAVLIGWSTSLPELVLSIGTATYSKVPDVSMGNVLGSNLFNILIIVFLDLYYWKGPILRTANSKIRLSVWLSLLMVLLVGGALFSHSIYQIPILKVGYDSCIIFVVYMACMWLLYRNEHKDEDPHLPEKYYQDKYAHVSMSTLTAKAMSVVALIVLAGLWLSQLAPLIAKQYALEQGFVGSFFLAIVSSLPEVITCFIAIRMGFHSMAFGTLFGSNIFNMAIIAFCDVFYRDGNIFYAVYTKSGLHHLSSVVVVVVMTLLTISILRFCKPTKKGWFIGFESIAITVLYLVALYCIYNPAFIDPVLAMLK